MRWNSKVFNLKSKISNADYVYPKPNIWSIVFNASTLLMLAIKNITNCFL